ncbi:MAG: C40 family peptidase [Actinobacteria bacterium]|nr:C40 family peptidase [Actinomycetota bacterium]
MRKAPAILTLLAAMLAAVGAASVKTAAADPTVSAKRAQAQDVLSQIREIDSQLSHAVEAYNLANVRLEQIDAELRANARHLGIARRSLKGAQAQLSRRLVSLYVNGSRTSGLEVLLGAESLDHLLSRLDAVDRVTEQDARVLREVKTFKAEVQTRKLKLRRARTAQAQEVAERAAQQSSIESQLREREQMLASVKEEIAQLEAAEARRQERLQAQARARVAALALEPESQETIAPVAEQPLAAPVEASAPVPDSRYGGVVGIAMQYLGVPYRWGGADPTGFDCSGFIMYVYAKVGVSLPHNAAMQYGLGTAVSKEQLQPGDLVFFDGLGHNGMYIGGGQFIHAPHSGDVVKISSLSDSWYAATWVGARRL